MSETVSSKAVSSKTGSPETKQTASGSDQAATALRKSYSVMDQNAEMPVQSPLHGAQAVSRTQTAGVRIREIAFSGHLVVRGASASEAFLDGCRQALGVLLPTKPLTSVSAGEVTVCWLSPDEWLVLLPAAQTFATERALHESIPVHHSVVNVSGGQTIIELSGSNAREVLMKSTPLDVHPTRFPIGKVAGSLLAKSQAVIHRVDEECWRVIVRRSFADYIWRRLADAGQEYGLTIRDSL